VPKISIIIPIYDQETEHHKLLDFFHRLNDSDLEIITTTGVSRAHAMNAGAVKATGDFLWFVHADTILLNAHIAALKLAVSNHPDCLHYFELSFQEKGITAMNSFGANIRSALFRLPWGDQAFCLSKDIFDDLKGYNESAAYGEDHLLVWKAHQKKIKLNHIPLAVKTSARQYKKRGWLNLTTKRQNLWIKQAIPEFLKWLKT
jgi:glycosyltransferase involved in cell wall biosynthesis